MNNAKIVRMLPRKNALARELKRLEERIDALTSRRDKLCSEYYELEGVSFVYKGVAISASHSPNCYGPDSLILRRADRKGDLNAYIYINAHNQKTFGLSLGCKRRDGEMAGAPIWKTHRLAVKIGLEYLVSGKKPTLEELEKRTRELGSGTEKPLIYVELPTDSFRGIPNLKKYSRQTPERED